jgi:hypothetical protein
MAYRHFSGYAATLRYWRFFSVILNDLLMNDHEMERELKSSRTKSPLSMSAPDGYHQYRRWPVQR